MNMNRSSNILLTVIACAVLNACGNGDNSIATETSNTAPSEQTQNSQLPTYHVATELNNYPLIIREADNSVISGFDLELLRAIAARQNINLDFGTPKPWAGIFDLLDKDEVDIIAGVSYSDDRAQKMNLTKPHLEYTFALLTTQKNANVQNFAEIKNQKIALKRDSLYETLGSSLWSGSDMLIRTDTTFSAVRNVLDGTADAALANSVALEYYAEQNKDKKLVVISDKNIPVGTYVYAVKKGNTQLQNLLDEGLDKVKADGTYDIIYKKYWKQ